MEEPDRPAAPTCPRDGLLRKAPISGRQESTPWIEDQSPLRVDWPAWLSAVGTVGAVALALWQLNREGRRRRREEHRAQAESVSVWYAGEQDERSLLAIYNGSPHPVSNLVATLTINDRPSEDAPDDSRAVVSTVPPGRWTVEMTYPGWRGMSAYPTAEIAFTDHRQTHWLRRSTGALEELNEDPLEHYEVVMPRARPVLRCAD